MEPTLSVTRSIVITAPPEHVWRVLTDPTMIAEWLTDFHFTAFEEGASFETGEGEDAEPGVIVAIDAPHRFAFRWTAEQKRKGMTLVEFTLEPLPEGTRLTVVESGFEMLPADIGEPSFSRNSKGWGYALTGLSRLVEGKQDDAGAGR